VLSLRDILDELAPTLDVEGAEGVSICRVDIDSRRVKRDSLFVALVGEHTDGHAYVADAFAAGASVALVACPVPGVSFVDTVRGVTSGLVAAPVALIVPDPLQALQALARARRNARPDVIVVAVTGSVGKTTSKEVIAAVVRQRFCTLKSRGNYNNEIGLPLTLLHLTPEHERVVLEMGMYDLGEIAHLAHIALPHIGVVTNVGPVHLERLGTIERIAQAKAELPQALPSAQDGGVAVLNIDDERVQAMAAQTKARVFTYGLTPEADLWADRIESEGLKGIYFRFHFRLEAIYARMPLLGRHSVHTALSAASVGLVEELSWDEILSGLQDQSAQLRLVAVPGPAGSTLLDDTYNSSPASCFAAFNLLQEIEGRKIAVLGDMYELGQYEKEAHKLVGRRACEVVDLLVTVGPLGRLIGQEALEAGMAAEAVYMVDTNSQAIDLLRTLIAPASPGDKVLVKGSRGMEMEAIVAALQKGVAS